DSTGLRFLRGDVPFGCPLLDQRVHARVCGHSCLLDNTVAVFAQADIGCDCCPVDSMRSGRPPGVRMDCGNSRTALRVAARVSKDEFVLLTESTRMAESPSKLPPSYYTL